MKHLVNKLIAVSKCKPFAPVFENETIALTNKLSSALGAYSVTCKDEHKIIKSIGAVLPFLPKQSTIQLTGLFLVGNGWMLSKKPVKSLLTRCVIGTIIFTSVYK